VETFIYSQEMFRRLSGRRVETRPIKGTRPRFTDPAADLASARELCASPKETAELVMITDLLRNDLGRVCEFGSVRVDEMLPLVGAVVRGTRRALVGASARFACLPSRRDRDGDGCCSPRGRGWQGGVGAGD